MTVSPLTPAQRSYDPIDLSSKAFWSTTAAEREKAFAQLRARRPVSWHRPVEESLLPDPEDPGYWAVTRHADVQAVSRDSETFLSGKGVLFDSVPEEAAGGLAVLPRHGCAATHADPQGGAFGVHPAAGAPGSKTSIKANARAIVEELQARGQRGRLRGAVRQGTADPHPVGHGGYPGIGASAGGPCRRRAGVLG